MRMITIFLPQVDPEEFHVKYMHFIFCIQIICKIFHLKDNTLDICKKIVLVVTNMKGIIITYRSLKLFSIIFVFRIHLKALVSFKEVRVHSLKGLCTKDSQSFSSTLNCFRHMLKNAMQLNSNTQLFFQVLSMGQLFKATIP